MSSKSQEIKTNKRLSEHTLLFRVDHCFRQQTSSYSTNNQWKKQQTRELISIWKMSSKHKHRGLSLLRWLSPGVQVNARYINSVRSTASDKEMNSVAFSWFLSLICNMPCVCEKSAMWEVCVKQNDKIAACAGCWYMYVKRAWCKK